MYSRILSFDNFETINNIKNIRLNSINHLQEVNMNYFEHLKFSSFLGLQFFIASQKAFIHALIPGLFTTSSTDYTDSLNRILQKKNL